MLWLYRKRLWGRSAASPAAAARMSSLNRSGTNELGEFCVDRSSVVERCGDVVAMVGQFGDLRAEAVFGAVAGVFVQDAATALHAGFPAQQWERLRRRQRPRGTMRPASRRHRRTACRPRGCWLRGCRARCPCGERPRGRRRERRSCGPPRVAAGASDAGPRDKYVMGHRRCAREELT